MWDARLVTVLEVSDDGEHYRTVRPLTLLWPVTSVNFEKVTARYFRIHIPAQGPYFYNQYKNGFPLGVVELHAEPRIEDISSKASYIRHDGYHDEPPISPQATLAARPGDRHEREDGRARQFHVGCAGREVDGGSLRTHLHGEGQPSGAA